MSGNCTICGKVLSRTAKTGLCKPHFLEKWNSDPATRAKRVEGVRRYAASPAGRLANKARAKAAVQKRLATPEGRAKAAESMRRIQPMSYTPEAMARRDNVTMAKVVSDTKLAWCPPQYRDLHRYLSQSKRLPLSECKAVIFAQAKIDRARMSPFERQDADLAKQMARAA